MRQTGLLCVATIELPYGLIVSLVERGYLENASDPVARGKAIERFLAESLGR